MSPKKASSLLRDLSAWNYPLLKGKSGAYSNVDFSPLLLSSGKTFLTSFLDADDYYRIIIPNVSA